MSNIDKNFFKYEQATDKLKTIDEELSDSETILFRTKPKKSAYICEASFKLFPIALIWLIFDTFGMTMIISSGIPAIAIVPIILFFMVHLTPFWLWLGGTLKATAEYKNIEYVITDKRILIKNGLTDVSISSITFKSIKSFDLQKSFTDQILHVGDIYVVCDEQKVKLCDIENPAFILKKLQELTAINSKKIEFPTEIKPEVTEEIMEEKSKKKQYRCPGCGASRMNSDEKCPYCGHIFSKY